MSKLGLCVNYNCDNYGSMLQIFATQKILENYGWDYEIIRYDKKTWLFYIKNIFRIFNANFIHDKIMLTKRKIELAKHPDLKIANDRRHQLFQEFRDTFIGEYSEIFKGYNRLSAAARNYDAVMVGSDQLWLPAGLGSGFYTLKFVPDNIRKISFATSFGVKEIPRYQVKRTKKYLERIESISVRETKGKEIIQKLTNKECTIALDPTLMFEAAEWDSYFPNDIAAEKPYIFAYFLGKNSESRNKVKKFAEERNLTLITCPHLDQFVQEDLTFGDKKMFDVTPVDFLNLIRNAEYICTDSFHGSAFSILFHKNFISFDRFPEEEKLSTNNRLDSLFTLLGLKNRACRNNILKIAELADESIDYSSVDNKLKELRKQTNAFLHVALH